MSTNLMNDCKTLTGITLAEAVVELQKVLPEDAYKSAPGSGGFTDINPWWARKVFTDVFGVMGMGWEFSYSPEQVTVTSQEKKSSSGRDYTLYTASIDYAELRYAYLDGEGNLVWSRAIPCNGGSDNEQRHYAVRGAITNAMNAGFAGLLWQLPVYLGVLDHNNAGAFTVGEVPSFTKKAPKSVTTTKTPTTSTTSRATTAARPVATSKPVAAAAKPAAVKADPNTGEILEDEPMNEPVPTTQTTPTTQDKADFVIPVSVSKNWGGKTLETIALSGRVDVLEYFTRVATGGDPAKQQVKTAVSIYLKAHPELMATGQPSTTAV